MGYEIRLHIGKSSPTITEIETEEYRYFSIYAMVDICKPGYDSEIYKLKKEKVGGTKRYFYGIGGEERIIKDMYGEEFSSFKVKSILRILKNDNKEDPYRRFTWAIALLEAMVNDQENLEVIMYGY